MNPSGKRSEVACRVDMMDLEIFVDKSRASY